jgi:magnesium-transporting ATPase (P-type)
MDDFLGEQINDRLQAAMKGLKLPSGKFLYLLIEYNILGYERLHYMPFDARVKRTESTIRKPDGQIIKITKGAPHIVGALDHNEKLRSECEGFFIFLISRSEHLMIFFCRRNCNRLW